MTLSIKAVAEALKSGRSVADIQKSATAKSSIFGKNKKKAVARKIIAVNESRKLNGIVSFSEYVSVVCVGIARMMSLKIWRIYRDLTDEIDSPRFGFSKQKIDLFKKQLECNADLAPKIREEFENWRRKALPHHKGKQLYQHGEAIAQRLIMDEGGVIDKFLRSAEDDYIARGGLKFFKTPVAMVCLILSLLAFVGGKDEDTGEVKGLMAWKPEWGRGISVDFCTTKIRRAVDNLYFGLKIEQSYTKKTQETFDAILDEVVKITATEATDSLSKNIDG